MNKEIIAVAGTGTMGGGIAQMFAENGFKTRVWDVNPTFTAKGVENIRKRLSKSVEKGKIAATDAETVMSRIIPTDSLGAFADADLVIEAIIENENAKFKLYRQLEAVIRSTAIIGTNTSSLSVTGLSRQLGSPERFLGLHFFNPPTKLKLVEVITTSALKPEVLPTVNALLTRCGKQPVTVKDAPGFIVNRLLLPFINEAAKLVDAGVACPADIDTAMRLGTLHPAGPLQVADLIGLDICRDILEKLANALADPHYRPAKSIVDLVDAGKLGRKSGQGFYNYSS